MHGNLKNILNAAGVELYSYMSINKSNFEDINIVSNYPDEWKERYVHSRFQHVDPVIACAKKKVMPFGWGTYFKKPYSFDATK
ncbi:autoinducer binding domain-containing protein, partial [Pantoea endophytica]